MERLSEEDLSDCLEYLKQGEPLDKPRIEKELEKKMKESPSANKAKRLELLLKAIRSR